MTYTNDEGNFSIEAKVGDSIYVSSLFHIKKIRVIAKEDFEHIVVVEVVNTVNKLDEIYLEKINEKKFDSIRTNEQLQTQIKTDIEMNPHLYSPPSNGNIDFLAIAKLIAGLFKGKRTKKEEISVETIKHRELMAFFEEDEFFNEGFLELDLQILPKYKPLFFDYCDAKGIEKTLFKKENQLLLIDKLVTYSKEFRERLHEDPTD